jgi:osmotically inducible lipoprotein OsmB
MRHGPRFAAVLAVAVLTSACAGLSDRQQRTLTGAATGAAGGAVLGAVIDDDAIGRGAVLGAAVGAAAGYLIDRDVDDWDD